MGKAPTSIVKVPYFDREFSIWQYAPNSLKGDHFTSDEVQKPNPEIIELKTYGAPFIFPYFDRRDRQAIAASARNSIGGAPPYEMNRASIPSQHLEFFRSGYYRLTRHSLQVADKAEEYLRDGGRRVQVGPSGTGRRVFPPLNFGPGARFHTRSFLVTKKVRKQCSADPSKPSKPFLLSKIRGLVVVPKSEKEVPTIPSNQ